MWEQILNLINRDLVEYLLYTFTFDLVIAATSVFLIEALKVSIEKISGRSTPAFLKLITSLAVIVGVSLLMVIIFHNEEKVHINRLLLIIVVTVKSWALATLCYKLFFKMVFSSITILYNKIKEYHTGSEIDLSRLTIKLMKNKTLLEKEFFLRKMQKLEMAEALKNVEGEIK